MKRAGLLCFLLCVVLSGCDTTPAKLTLVSPETTIEASRVKQAAQQVSLLPIEDQRSEDETLGIVAGRPFRTTDLPACITQSLNGLAPLKYHISKDVPQETAQLVLKVTILKAYVQSIRASKVAVLVLKVQFAQRGINPPIEQIVRGQYAGPNWASTATEVQGALQDALQQCMQQIRMQIDNCFIKGSPS